MLRWVLFQSQLQTVRAELMSCRSRLNSAEQQATERDSAASRAIAQHDEAREQARHAHCELQLLRVRMHFYFHFIQIWNNLEWNLCYF